MERPESATKVPEAGSRISPARYCTSTRRPRKAEYRAILYLVSESAGNKVNSTEGPPTEGLCKMRMARPGRKPAGKNSLRGLEQDRLPEKDQRRVSLIAPRRATFT